MNATWPDGSLSSREPRDSRRGFPAVPGRRGSLLLLLLASISIVRANPQGGVVRQGSATFSAQGAQLNITTSGRTFIDWSGFNIGSGETTRFFQPSCSSVVWNRINDGNPSQIL